VPSADLRVGYVGLAGREFVAHVVLRVILYHVGNIFTYSA
jgi:hypothetical protein